MKEQKLRDNLTTFVAFMKSTNNDEEQNKELIAKYAEFLTNGEGKCNGVKFGKRCRSRDRSRGRSRGRSRSRSRSRSRHGRHTNFEKHGLHPLFRHLHKHGKLNNAHPHHGHRFPHYGSHHHGFGHHHPHFGPGFHFHPHFGHRHSPFRGRLHDYAKSGWGNFLNEQREEQELFQNDHVIESENDTEVEQVDLTTDGEITDVEGHKRHHGRHGHHRGRLGHFHRHRHMHRNKETENGTVQNGDKNKCIRCEHLKKIINNCKHQRCNAEKTSSITIVLDGNIDDSQQEPAIDAADENLATLVENITVTSPHNEGD